MNETTFGGISVSSEVSDSAIVSIGFHVRQSLLHTSSKVESIILRFHNSLVDDVLDKFGFAVQLVPDALYHFTTTVLVELTLEFLGWVFSLGACAEIIGPESVRRKMY